MSPAYEEGAEQFLEFASKKSRSDEDGKYFCPCINCLNGRRQLLDDIREHLLCDEIKKNYTTWWIDRHVEGLPIWTDWCTNGRSLRGNDSWSWTRIFLGSTCLYVWYIASGSKKPLYLGCKKSLTLLSVVLSLVNVKTIYGWSGKSFTSFLQVV